MMRLFRGLIGRSAFACRDLLLETLALCQQPSVHNESTLRCAFQPQTGSSGSSCLGAYPVEEKRGCRYRLARTIHPWNLALAAATRHANWDCGHNCSCQDIEVEARRGESEQLKKTEREALNFQLVSIQERKNKLTDAYLDKALDRETNTNMFLLETRKHIGKW
jgi:hypothetical protein